MTIKISLPLLLAALVVLKLTNVITISWWWVLSPLWLPVALVFALAAIVIVVALLFVAFVLWIDAPR